MNSIVSNINVLYQNWTKILKKRLVGLKNIWRNRKPIQSLVLNNQAIRLYSIPKVAFISVTILTKLARLKIARVWLVTGFIGLEMSVAGWRTRRQYLSGTALIPAASSGLLHFSLSFLLLSIFNLAFTLFSLPVAILTNLLVGTVGLAGTLAINLFLLVLGMQSSKASINSKLFQQVRQMQNLEEALVQIQARSAIVKDRTQKLDLRFYLGWTETYLGHQALSKLNWKSAQQYYQKALEADPSNPSAKAALILTLASQNYFQKAIQLYEQLTGQVMGKGAAKSEPVLWNRHVNETSSEYEINAGLFQLGAFLYSKMNQVAMSPKTSKDHIQISALEQEKLQQQILNAVAGLPDRTADELLLLISKKAGGTLGALNVLLAGPYREPANPLEYLTKITLLPALNKATVE